MTMAMRARLYRMAVLAGVLAALPLGLHAAGAVKDLPVTSTIVDSDPSGSAYQIQNDDQGAYTNSKSVQSVIQSIGDWVLDTNYSSLSTRGVYLDFSRPLGLASPFTTDPIAVKARLITQCPTYGSSVLSLKLNQVAACGLVIGFDYAGSSYRLAMNPSGVNGYTDTDTVNVTCTGAGPSGQCNRWNIAGAGNGSTAKLLVSTKVNRKIIWEDKGNYEFSFSISVSNP
jgi:hypothetical protein